MHKLDIRLDEATFNELLKVTLQEIVENSEHEPSSESGHGNSKWQEPADFYKKLIKKIEHQSN
jgi:hypothetical protein